MQILRRRIGRRDRQIGALGIYAMLAERTPASSLGRALVQHLARAFRP